MVEFIKAKENHLEKIIDLLADDTIGKIRENNSRPILPSYIKTFNSILDDENVDLIVGVLNDDVIAVAQQNYLSYLTYQGGRRAQIEGVRVRKDCRGQGVGKLLFEYLIKLAKQKQCHLVQLTTDKKRPDAFRFYEVLGFKASHEGFKLHF
jgi:GNAT superfamily N-acetyltransferase